MKKIISTDKAPKAIGPYSQAIEFNNMVFTSGVIPVNPETNELVSGPIEIQAEQAIKNLAALLTESGSSVDNVIKTTVFIKDMNDFGKVNEIYAFTDDKKISKEFKQTRNMSKFYCKKIKLNIQERLSSTFLR